MSFDSPKLDTTVEGVKITAGISRFTTVGYGIFYEVDNSPIRTGSYRGTSKIYKKEGTARAVSASHPGTYVKTLYIREDY